MKVYVKRDQTMKTKYSFFMLLAACCMESGSMFAQDRVITKKGDVMEVYHVEVSDKYIFFNRDKSVDSAIERMAKDSVLMIRRQDGSVVNLNGADEGTASNGANVQTAAAEAPQPEMVILTPDMLDEHARQANAASISRMNAPVTFESKEPDDLKKKANCVWFRMGVKENSVLDDGVVSLEMVSGTFQVLDYKGSTEFKPLIYEGVNPGVQVKVVNKGDRTIYIDLAKCFFVRMGLPQCYYVPSATSVTSTSSSGVGVNLGALTGALGIGGVVGTLAGGVNVGGGGSKGSTTVTYAQRMLTVPPHTTVELEPQYLFGKDDNPIVVPGLSYSGKKLLKSPHFRFPKNAPEGPLLNGQHLTYETTASLFTVSALVAYSFSEDGSASRTLSAHFYLKDLVGQLRKPSLMKIVGGQVKCTSGVLDFYGDIEDRNGETGFPRK